MILISSEVQASENEIKGIFTECAALRAACAAAFLLPGQWMILFEQPISTISCSMAICYMMLYGSVSKPCTPFVHINIAVKWMFIPLKMVLIGINRY